MEYIKINVAHISVWIHEQAGAEDKLDLAKSALPNMKLRLSFLDKVNWGLLQLVTNENHLPLSKQLS